VNASLRLLPGPLAPPAAIGSKYKLKTVDGIPCLLMVYRMSNSSPTTFAASTVDRLRREIFGGQLPPGTRLAEAAEAKRLGVSRVPVREAFAALERDGLLEFTDTGRTVETSCCGDFRTWSIPTRCAI